MAIAVVGNVFVDIKGFPLGKYDPLGKNAGQVLTVHGGVGRNVAEDIANLELRPSFVSMVDDTAQGLEVLEDLRLHGVDTRYVLRTPGGMGLWLAIFDSAGDLAGSISKRPVMTAMEALLEQRGDEIFAGADSIVLEIDMDPPIVRRVLDYAEKYSKRVCAVVANMNIAVLHREQIRRVDCLVCNVQEAGILFGRELSALEPDMLAEALSGLLESETMGSVAVTLGGRGAVFAERGGAAGYLPAKAVAVRDTTGAGDAFCAGVAAGLTYGKTLADAVALGNRLGASAITVAENVCPHFLPSELGLEPPVRGR